MKPTQAIGSLRWWASRHYAGSPCKSLIRCGRAYCWPIGQRIASVTDVDRGNWMTHLDLDAEPWVWVELTDEQFANFTAAARDCYCYCAGIERCDFCTSMRTPDGAPWSSGEAFDGETN